MNLKCENKKFMKFMEKTFEKYNLRRLRWRYDARNFSHKRIMFVNE
jgi:hypothetical protein